MAFYFKCLACRSKNKLKHLKSANQDVQLQKGQEMLSRDLDIVNLLEMVKDYKLMKDVFFTQDDRFFLKLQHRNMICSSTSSEDQRSSSPKNGD